MGLTAEKATKTVNEKHRWRTLEKRTGASSFRRRE
jgi:hypothetical protein